MSAGSYLLARFNNRDDLVPAAQQLASIDSVSRWDAVDGYFNLVVKLGSSDTSGVEKVKKLGGLQQLKRCDIVTDNESAVENDPTSCRSYVFLEVDQQKQDEHVSILSVMPGVVFCSPTTGDFDMVVLVAGSDFDQIDRTVDEKIRPLDGILRVKTDRIIDLNSI